MAMLLPSLVAVYRDRLTAREVLAEWEFTFNSVVMAASRGSADRGGWQRYNSWERQRSHAPPQCHGPRRRTTHDF